MTGATGDSTARSAKAPQLPARLYQAAVTRPGWRMGITAAAEGTAALDRGTDKVVAGGRRPAGFEV